jgi:predicted ATPase
MDAVNSIQKDMEDIIS